MVVKADGLAAGKGVVVALGGAEEACAAVDDMMIKARPVGFILLFYNQGRAWWWRWGARTCAAVDDIMIKARPVGFIYYFLRRATTRPAHAHSPPHVPLTHSRSPYPSLTHLSPLSLRAGGVRRGRAARRGGGLFGGRGGVVLRPLRRNHRRAAGLRPRPQGKNKNAPQKIRFAFRGDLVARPCWALSASAPQPLSASAPQRLSASAPQPRPALSVLSSSANNTTGGGRGRHGAKHLIPLGAFRLFFPLSSPLHQHLFSPLQPQAQHLFSPLQPQAVGKGDTGPNISSPSALSVSSPRLSPLHQHLFSPLHQQAVGEGDTGPNISSPSALSVSSFLAYLLCINRRWARATRGQTRAAWARILPRRW